MTIRKVYILMNLVTLSSAKPHLTVSDAWLQQSLPCIITMSSAAGDSQHLLRLSRFIHVLSMFFTLQSCHVILMIKF